MAFFVKKSLNGATFHMHVSDFDSKKICKFHEIWRTLSKCVNFILFISKGLIVGQICEKIVHLMIKA